MAIQTGSTYIFESMTDIITIPMTPRVFDHCEPKENVPDNSNNDRQLEMAVDTGNTYISETMKDIKIPTANLAFTTTVSSKKMSASDCNSD